MDIIKELGPLAIASRMKRLAELVFKQAINVYRVHGIDFEPKWFPLFYLLSQKESIGVMEASEYLNISHPAVIQFVKELEKKGWVMSEKSPEDARKRILKLTEKGWAFLPQLQEIWDNIKTVNQQLISKEAHDLMRSVEAFEQYFLKDGFYIDYYQKYIDEKSK
ncbi:MULTISPECIES: MarR family winged helix-turn-helix transcriptional regulator [Flectobacillus]|jgi:DNA-binding MarR family transcriptional regulator|uniref:MarR family transcriptional regulator n=2 Tax=Flectobacillus TaxID=101 RepID=A0ABT6YUG7_9BACT|nr:MULTISPECIES: MarR family transcriptional regulator [Flectobacillus]MDI9861486.1 MarR family transcriptional regulator [Flectobacillus roseus]MDI9867230.1 MarR family transcriptional regulator [Flectobacillus longus]MDI9880006.1 MarR family transcriptional regulator [Flectobacillus longus]NBA77738.1 MarR family transcriptional regulator [Emticicia sp. ODNR4P]